MNKTKIEWCNYTINPIKGLCKGGCWYCYARKMYKRFHWNEEIRYIPTELDKIKTIKEPSRFFLCSTHDLFGEWIPDKWIFDIITKCQRYSQHTFLLLTKNPERYASWTFRNNFLLGASINEKKDLWRIDTMRNIGGFISIEPLLEDVSDLSFRGIKWLIIGGLTPKPQHKKEWIDKILEQADELKIPIFIKHNANYPKTRQDKPPSPRG